VIDDMRICGAAADAFHAGIVLKRITVNIEKPPACLCLRFISLRAGIPRAKINVAVLDAENADMPFPVKRNTSRRRILPVGANAIERAVDIQRDLAFGVAVADVALAPEGAATSEAGLIFKMNGFRVCRGWKRRKGARHGG